MRTMTLLLLVGLLLGLATECSAQGYCNITAPSGGSTYARGATIVVAALANPGCAVIARAKTAGGTKLAEVLLTESVLMPGSFSGSLLPPAPNNLWPASAVLTIEVENTNHSIVKTVNVNTAAN